jgi:hypothetical protein
MTAIQRSRGRAALSTFLFCVVLGAAGGLGAQTGTYFKGNQTVSNTALTIADWCSSATCIADVSTNSATWCVESNPVRYRYDGGVPTATVGMPLVAGQCVTLTGHRNVAAFRVIRQAADALLTTTVNRP